MADVKQSKQLPQTDSIQALAEFWDSNDVTEFEAQLEEVPDPIFERDLSLTIHLLPDEEHRIVNLAKANGVSKTALVKQWVLEKLTPPA